MNDADDIDLPEEELYEHLRIEIDKGQDLLRIDKYLMNRVQNATRTKIQQAAEAGSVLVNGKAVKANYRVKPFDVVTIVLSKPPREIELIPENIPIHIVYEDEHIVVVNKVPGMVVHPGYGNYRGTLVNALVYHFQHLPASKTSLNPDTDIQRPGLVHRIDKNTSGIIIIAKTELAMMRLAKDFFDRNMDRKYIALVWGNVEQNEGTITGNVGRNLKNRKVMDVFPNGDIGKHAITHYKVLERFGYVTLIECKLETGRTHQIRVHMKHLGHPLFNDIDYGGDRILKGTTFSKYKQFVENCFAVCPRHALHAKTLGLKHPATGKPVFFDSEIPADMTALIEKWRKYSSAKDLE